MLAASAMPGTAANMDSSWQVSSKPAEIGQTIFKPKGYVIHAKPLTEEPS